MCVRSFSFAKGELLIWNSVIIENLNIYCNYRTETAIFVAKSMKKTI